MWKAHKSVTFSVKLATLLADKIFSVSKQSFRVKTKKANFIGHGIDTKDRFKKQSHRDKIENIIVVGRVSSTKNILLLVRVFVKLLEQFDFLKLYIVGDVENNSKYFEQVKSTIPDRVRKNVIFTGSIKFNTIVGIYKKMNLAVNLSDTGSLDKAIIEPMALGIPVITSNDTAHEIFKHLDNKGVFLVSKEDLYNKFVDIVDNKYSIDRTLLRDEVVKNHSLENLARIITSEFKK